MIHRAVLAGFLLAAQGALACGYCVEDKVALVYDHSVIVRALNKRHEVAFLAIEEPLAAGPGLQRELERVIESTPGVDRASARVSLAGASLSFAYNPARAPLGSIMRSLDKNLGAKGIRTTLLRVVNENPGGSVTKATPGRGGS
jgi:hypothetical protein